MGNGSRAIAATRALLTWNVAEYVGANEAEEDDGHWQRVVGEQLALARLQVWPFGNGSRGGG